MPAPINTPAMTLAQVTSPMSKHHMMASHKIKEGPKRWRAPVRYFLTSSPPQHQPLNPRNYRCRFSLAPAPEGDGFGFQWNRGQCSDLAGPGDVLDYRSDHLRPHLDKSTGLAPTLPSGK